MKKIVRVLALCTVLLGAAALASAQSNLSVDVPFAFQIGDHVMPAGTYSITRVFDRDPSLLAFTGVHTRARVNVYGSPVREGAGTGLSFLRYGETYFLTAISTPSGKIAVASPRNARLTASAREEFEINAGSK